MNNFERTKQWLQACGKEPSDAAASVQIGCHIEEVCEFLECLRTPKEGHSMLLDRVLTDLQWWAAKLKSGETMAYIPTYRRAAALDALCDADVTGNGVAYLSGFDKPGADATVLDSNDDKLQGGKAVILEGGKIGKRPGWRAPNLDTFVMIKK